MSSSKCPFYLCLNVVVIADACKEWYNGCLVTSSPIIHKSIQAVDYGDSERCIAGE